ncbi:outer-membrane lipoprotein carrier protein LolA [Candidatus Tisiphia endosymbiont of Parasteatoda lunata]|uniref:outer-membrane lipoprotein carrier protein LolA n=1 Tax=Candidatus Tisiphia endosymbiont of Parasteatoda lunata TaxID=3066275 RepID=UPI003977831F
MSWLCKGIIAIYWFLTIAYAEVEFLHNSTSTGNLGVGTRLESSRTLEYATILRSDPPTNSLVEANSARVLILENRSFDNKAIDQLKIYLREIKSMAVDFSQEDSAGNKAEGKLLINKPSKFRCNYYPPFPLVVIGNTNYVSVYDYDMKHVSRIKAEENVFNFLLEDSIDFDKYFKIESVIDQDNMFKITIYHTLLERRSQITFDKKTKQIKKLEILEDENVITIIFNHIAKVQKFDDDLFKLKNPDIFGTPSRLTKNDIEKKYNLAT